MLSLSHAYLCCDYQVRIKLFRQVFLFHDKELIALWMEVFFLWSHNSFKLTLQDDSVLERIQKNADEFLWCPCFTNSAIKPHGVEKQEHTETNRPTCKVLSTVLCHQHLSIRDLKEHTLNMTFESNTIHYSRQCWLWRGLDRQWSDQRCFDMSNFGLHSRVLL